MSGMNQPAPASSSSRLFSDTDDSGGGNGSGNGSGNGVVAPGGVGPGSPGIAGPYDGNGDGAIPGAASSRGSQETAAMDFGQGGGQRADRRGYSEHGVGGRAGGALDGSQGRGISVSLGGGPGAGVVKGEVQRGRPGEEDALRKRPRESWRWVTFYLERERKGLWSWLLLLCCVWMVVIWCRFAVIGWWRERGGWGGERARYRER